MDTNPTPRTPPQAWIDALKCGEADIAAGRVVPWPMARAVIEEVLAAMERGADAIEQERLLLALNALADDTCENAPTSKLR